MFPFSTLLALIGVGIWGILFLLYYVRHSRGVESCIVELAKIINGNIKKNKIFYTCEYKMKGEYKGREIVFNTAILNKLCNKHLIIGTKPRNAQTVKIPFLSFRLRNKKIAPHIYINIFSGQLYYERWAAGIHKPYREHLIKILDELITKAVEIESQEWEKVIAFSPLRKRTISLI